jgi:hypothetical protein
VAVNNRDDLAQYFLEANEALYQTLGQAIEDGDWDRVEATASALVKYARTHTLPGGA